jgi:hypothetical protein
MILNFTLIRFNIYITSYTGQIQAVVVVHFQPFVLIKILLANLKISIRCCLINLSRWRCSIGRLYWVCWFLLNRESFPMLKWRWVYCCRSFLRTNWLSIWSILCWYHLHWIWHCREVFFRRILWCADVTNSFSSFYHALLCLLTYLLGDFLHFLAFMGAFTDILVEFF